MPFFSNYFGKTEFIVLVILSRHLQLETRVLGSQRGTAKRETEMVHRGQSKQRSVPGKLCILNTTIYASGTLKLKTGLQTNL